MTRMPQLDKSKPQFSKATLPDGRKVETKSMPEQAADLSSGLWEPIKMAIGMAMVYLQQTKKYAASIKADKRFFY